MRKSYIAVIMLWIAAGSVFGTNPDPFGFSDTYQQKRPSIVPVGEKGYISEIFGPYASQSGLPNLICSPERHDGVNLPQNVLVLMVQFSDTKFEESITNRDYLADPKYTITDFIGRYMFHLKSYYLDASKDKYKINYTVLDTLITLNNTMEFYGDRSNSLVRRVRMVRDVISIVDPIIDFAEYDSYIIFHSGAGRETDIYGENPNTIPSSFINRRLLQSVMDPDNDDYPGLSTNDGVYIKEIIITASHQNHKIAKEETNYSGFGLLVYLFGRQIGLPTLFGNVSRLGRAAGAGNFCIMGTGAWNANGYVPPYLSAWVRYFMGWEEAELITGDAEALKLDYPFKQPFKPDFISEEHPPIPRLYKVPIRLAGTGAVSFPYKEGMAGTGAVSCQYKEGTDMRIADGSEYYLIENREQNPDGAMLGTQPRFTFELLPDGEQDYYDAPFDMVPRFNFMKNTYRGCEWDFYLPGYGGPEVDLYIDGSGILIWHIDENIIRERFADNTINADPGHQGVTLIEADGIQHLRSSIPNMYMRGSPYDSFRKGHNDYFGYKIGKDGGISIPYAESYYGFVEMEIFNISESGPEMSFSVNRGDIIDYQYEGDDSYPIGVVEHVCSCEEVLFIPTESGKVFMMINDLPVPGYPVQIDPITQLYVYSPEYGGFFVPTTTRDSLRSGDRVSKLYRLTPAPEGSEVVKTYIGYEWSTHPLIVQTEHAPVSNSVRSRRQNETDIYLVAALHNELETKIVFYDLNFRIIEQFIYQGVSAVSNMMQKGDKLYILMKEGETGYIYSFNLNSLNGEDAAKVKLGNPEGDYVQPDMISLLAPVTRTVNQTSDRYKDNIIILTNDNKLYLLNLDGTICDGFPVLLDEQIKSVPVLSDISLNGFLDILLVSSNSLYVVDYAGKIRKQSLAVNAGNDMSDNGYGQGRIKPSLGVVVADINNNGKPEIAATHSGNRIVVRDNNLQKVSGYPLITMSGLRHSPVITKDEDRISFLYGMRDGKIMRRYMPDAALDEDSFNTLWNNEYGNLQRTASYSFDLPENLIKTSAVFVKENCFVFPSPLTYANGGVVYFNMMVSKDVPVSIKVFDISGKLVFQDIHDCRAYVNYRDDVSLSINELSTGAYFVLLKAEGVSLELRFAVEK